MLGLDYMHLVAGTAALALPLSYVISRKVCKRNCRQRSRECISVLVDKTGKKCEMIAHKGAALDGPENTLGAIERAAFNGFDGVELDVQLTRDKVAVVIHDETVDRTTDGTGKVQDLTFKEISKLNAAAKFDGEWKQSETVPLMADAIEMSLRNNLFLFFDVKDTSAEALDQIVEQYQKHEQLYQRSAVSAFDFSFLYKLKQRDDNIPVVPLFERFTLGEIRKYRGFSYMIRVIPTIVHQAKLHMMFYYINPLLLDFNLMSVSQDLVDDRFIAWAESWGKDVVVWTVNDDLKKFELINNKRLSVMTDSISQSSCSSSHLESVPDSSISSIAPSL
ncbi:glycerophosphodiester phosphodiesterase 1-like isoform X2 [Convolutriloba macropyga]|uniref:glycerophosphodiester phosphodiesterase 1-like isoform X2 n=1 Tax=Convolutriloba macropyga TaxID=536237 RepID=UPI003F5210CE